MSVPTLPQIAPTDCRVSLVKPMQHLTSPLSGHLSYQRTGVDYWQLHIIWRHLAAPEFRALCAFFDGLEGLTHAFTCSLAFLKPLEALDAVPKFARTYSGGSQITVTPKCALPTGSFISFTDALGSLRLHRLVQIAVRANDVVLHIAPALRATVDAGTALDTSAPAGRFCLVQAPETQLSAGLGGYIDITVRERL